MTSVSESLLMSYYAVCQGNSCLYQPRSVIQISLFTFESTLSNDSNVVRLRY